jgi:hypothetical protein
MGGSTRQVFLRVSTCTDTNADADADTTHGMYVPLKKPTDFGFVGKIVREVCRVHHGRTSGKRNRCMGASLNGI